MQPYETDFSGVTRVADRPVAAPAEGQTSVARILVALLLGGALTWLVVTKSLVAHLAEAQPDLALTIAPSDPVALMQRADRLLNPPADATGARPQAEQSAQSPSQPQAPPPPPAAAIEEARRAATLALAGEPLSARGLRILGQVASLHNETARTAALMDEAARRSANERGAIFWAMLHNLERKDYATSLRYADVLLRRQPDLATLVVPALARMAELPAASGLIKTALAASPPWRERFFAGLTSHIADARTPLDLLLSLRGTAAPASQTEISGYLDFLIGRGLHDLAYYTWLQFLPPEKLAVAGNVYNGSFSQPASSLAFDWSLRPGSGVTMDVVLAPESNGNRGLYIEFGSGRVELGQVSQRLMLVPGRYDLHVKVRGELKARRGLKWVVACASQSSQTLGETTLFLGAERSWRQFEVGLTVPPTGCRSQLLRLVHDARSASEQFISGHVWYDDISLVMR